MVDVGIVGVTGYTGQELIRILLNHPEVRISGLFSKSSYNKSIQSVFPEFASRLDLVCVKPDIKDICAKCDLVFLALPHTVSMKLVPSLLYAGKKVIDLSAAYRLKDVKDYAKFYEVKHKDISGLKEAVYGLPELYRNEIKAARLVANPGCYPTAAILSLAPLVAFNIADFSSIIIDAKSGVSGAGKKMVEAFLFSEVNEDFRAYKVGVHQHTPEINQELSKLGGKKINVVFVPHLLPLNRGILETIYVKKDKKGRGRGKDLIELYKKFYKKEPFVRIRAEGQLPKIKDVVGTNFCDIGIKEDGDNVIVISAIDNLLKGASGQAVQNMNIMYGFREYTGLL
ncbi:MAG: N-acetyl-gamma-glutamyl-phosphate reductase [Candidatus Omnitrophica bacterium CG08_land_8_20_14_0_20_41_16]|uniref:N-acetyl-gamma-glutamyl-phosphate reductase n=1 Tax=Candidatus Sherwoodlollariibacterium unditelluris TaxID=1974757 RepID=A0A2G9YJF6_9BACT|nr:MAG: N-acetyl-gamma-glutamyl-phosphate reductase [Candidatus Omnitrophica bacterium CG23_combo_of_CG06-09_8_20_14_all_41_10]PIS33388.1 MAG: N-acetyl-gamma-glutamyl-phosphate reductase [Candidatus Omnitrophica bacterium CG08_land_8_20_14_0_20_41_16]